MVSLVLDRLGRKKTFFLVNAFSFASWITVATASHTDRESMFAQLLAGRILLGISSGLSSSPCGIYTAEIAHSSIRGRMSILSSLGISVGILFVYIAGFFIPVGLHIIIITTMLIITILIENSSILDKLAVNCRNLCRIFRTSVRANYLHTGNTELASVKGPCC